MDYFATSLPTLLLFTDDQQARRQVTALFLSAQVAASRGQAAEGLAALEAVSSAIRIMQPRRTCCLNSGHRAQVETDRPRIQHESRNAMTHIDDKVLGVSRRGDSTAQLRPPDAPMFGPGRVLIEVGGAGTALAQCRRVSLPGEGSRLETEVPNTLLHKQVTIRASRVTSLQGMEDLAASHDRIRVNPELVVSHRFRLSGVDQRRSPRGRRRCGED